MTIMAVDDTNAGSSNGDDATTPPSSCSRKVYRKLFQDSIVVDIPLENNAGVTVDMGVVLRRSRAKRIQALHRHFPSLQNHKTGGAATTVNETEKESSVAQQPNEEAEDDDNNDNDAEAPADEATDNQKQRALSQSAGKKRRKDDTLPQREHYGSVVDYLEAKYVRGVMLTGDDVGQHGGDDDDDGDNDKESVYSEDSWLDDSLLKRDVAEQVLSQATQTKVGVDNDEDDDFFVNVGNLEVEDNDLLHYDPLQEEEKAKTAKKAKKRKRPDGASAKSSKSAKPSPSGGSGPSPKKKAGDAKSVASSKKMPSGSNKSSRPSNAVNNDNGGDSDELTALRQTVEEQRATLKNMSDRIVAEIKAIPKEDLPRKKKTIKVSLTVPEGKKVGDVITFSNPHIPGQRLKVQVPKDKSSGETFAVSMPAPQVTDESDGNKFTREVQELIADYATLYDAYCQVEADYHQADPGQTGKYPLKAKRIAKFDEMVKLLPSNLVTPLDAVYMKKIVRRARQNKKKRKEGGGDDDEQAAAVANASALAVAALKPNVKPAPKAMTAKAKPASKPHVKSIPKAAKHKLMKAVKPAAKAMKPAKRAAKPAKATVPKTRVIVLPSLGREFPTAELKPEEFAHMTNN